MNKVKKHLLITLAAILAIVLTLWLGGCNRIRYVDDATLSQSSVEERRNDSIDKQEAKAMYQLGGDIIVTIDSCEYIKSIYGSAPNTYCHKGNCSNPIHKTKQ